MRVCVTRPSPRQRAVRLSTSMTGRQPRTRRPGRTTPAWAMPASPASFMASRNNAHEVVAAGLVPLDDVVVVDPALGAFGDALVANPLVRAVLELVKRHRTVLRRREQADTNIHQPKAQCAGSHRPRHRRSPQRSGGRCGSGSGPGPGSGPVGPGSGLGDGGTGLSGSGPGGIGSGGNGVGSSGEGGPGVGGVGSFGGWVMDVSILNMRLTDPQPA